MKLLQYTAILTLILGLIAPSVVYAQDAEAGELAGRNCKNSKDLEGLWKLTNLYEQPAGDLTQQRDLNPHQYLIFAANGLYHEAAPEVPYKRYNQAINQTKNASKDIWQYLVGEKGVVYYYKNQIFSHSVYCAKVTTSSKDYRKGSMIITPTDTGGAQVYKTYQKIQEGKKKKGKGKKKKKK